MKKDKKTYNTNKSYYWWILGLICPVVGIILYFIWKKNDKKKASNILMGTIIGFIIVAITFLYFSTNRKDYFNRTVQSWYQDVSSGNSVVTVIGASYCSHCQEYKPNAKVLADTYNLNLYFYEVDTLSEIDKDTILNSFELTGYNGSVPYTAVFNDGKVVNYHEGFENSDVLLNFFKESGVIKN